MYHEYPTNAKYIFLDGSRITVVVSLVDKTVPDIYCVSLKIEYFHGSLIPVDTDVFKMPSGRLKKVATSNDQTRRRYNVWKKTYDLRRLQDFWFTTS